MIAGVGGVFLRSREPQRLAAWYRQTLGIQAEEHGGDFYLFEFPLREAEGERRLTRLVWAIFRAAEGEPATAGVTVNYRVDDMDALLAHLGSLGVAVSRTDEQSYGRFAWLRDPDGNEVELWQDIEMQP